MAKKKKDILPSIKEDVLREHKRGTGTSEIAIMFGLTRNTVLNIITESLPKTDFKEIRRESFRWA